MSKRTFHKLARLIFDAQWAVAGHKYSTRRASDLRSRDARRAAEFVLVKFEVKEKPAVSS
jgi:hypothetical protein